MNGMKFGDVSVKESVFMNEERVVVWCLVVMLVVGHWFAPSRLGTIKRWGRWAVRFTKSGYICEMTALCLILLFKANRNLKVVCPHVCIKGGGLGIHLEAKGAPARKS